MWKTTLLNILGCMDRFDEGEYLFDGINIHTYGEKKLEFAESKH